MSASEHPIAQRLATHIGTPSRLLATVMLLPLVDGIFPALVLSGGIDTLAGAVQTGILVFGGSATAAIILTEFHGNWRDRVKPVFLVGSVLVVLAVGEAALAPAIRQSINVPVFERFAALVLLSIAAKTASARVGDIIPSPGTIIAFGVLASATPADASLRVSVEPTLIVHAAVAALVGIGFALIVALGSTWFADVVDLNRFRFGSAISLGMIPLSLFGLAPMNSPLLILAVATLLTINPDASNMGATNLAESSAGVDD